MTRNIPKQIRETSDKNCLAILLGLWACAVDVFGKTIEVIYQCGNATGTKLWIFRILQFLLLLGTNYTTWRGLQNSSNTLSDSFNMIMFRSIASSVAALICGAMLFEENILFSVLGVIMMLEGVSLLIDRKKEKRN